MKDLSTIFPVEDQNFKEGMKARREWMIKSSPYVKVTKEVNIEDKRYWHFPTITLNYD